MGKYNGIANGLFSANALVGNLIIAILFLLTLDANGNVPVDIRDIAIWILASLGAVGTLILAFLRSFLRSVSSFSFLYQTITYFTNVDRFQIAQRLVKV